MLRIELHINTDNFINRNYNIYFNNPFPMTRPFQYDNFVQSQIAVGNGSSHLQFGSGVRKN